jgi:hypothetical protein
VSSGPAGSGEACGPQNSRVATRAVAANQSEVELALTSARAARARASSELRKLELTITKLEGALALSRAGSDDDSAPARMTLHEAMRKVLQAAPMRMMHAQDLAVEIGRLDLYRRRDGRAIEPRQIHERTRNYPYLFERAGTLIKLKVVLEMKGR